MPKNRLVRALDSRRTTRAAVTNVTGGGTTTVTLDHGTLTGLADDDHTQYLNTTRGDARYVPLARTVTAGSGLTGGGALSANITLNVGAGTLLSVDADAVRLSNGTAQYQVPVTGPSATAPTPSFVPAYTALSTFAGAGLDFTGGQFVVGQGAGITVNANDVALASSVAGNGLKFTTGQLSIDAGTLITVGTTSVGLSNGTAQYQIPVTGASQSAPNPSFVPAYTALGTFAGAGLDFGSGQFFVGQGAGITVGATTVSLTTPGTLTHNSTSSSTGSHTHAITSSDNVDSSTTALLRATNGALTLDQLTLTDRVTGPYLVGTTSVNTNTLSTSTSSDLTITTSATRNLVLSPLGDVILDPTGKDVLPQTNYDINLGMLTKKYLTLHAAELWVETLVAQNTIATIGGRILVGPTTTLVRDLTTGATTIYVKHDQMTSGDRVYMETDGKVEFMAITSAPTTETDGYSYTVTRNLDGTGANLWYAGDAIFNTGTTGNGFIDLYSVRGVRANTEIGPTIVGNVRTGTTFNDWAPRWAIGNLNGLYGYSTNVYGFAAGNASATWVSADANTGSGVGGFRVNNGNVARFQVDTNGNLYLRDKDNKTRVLIDSGTGAMGFFDTNNKQRMLLGSDGRFVIKDSAGGEAIVLGNSGDASFTGTVTAADGAIGGWTLGATTLTGGNITLESNGINSNIRVGTGSTSAGIANAPSAGNVAFWAGSSFADRATSAAFQVTNGGVLTATGATISGALTATSGSFSGVLSIGASGGIYQGSGSFATPTTGLKVWNDSGAGRIAGYNGGTLQWGAGTDGKLSFGGGVGVLDSSGILVTASASGFNATSGYSFRDGSNNYIGGLGYSLSTSAAGNPYATPPPTPIQRMRLWAQRRPGYSGTIGIDITADGDTTAAGYLTLNATSTDGTGTAISLDGSSKEVEIWNDTRWARPSGATNYGRTLTIEGARAATTVPYAEIDFNNTVSGTTYTSARIEARYNGAGPIGRLRMYVSNANTETEALRLDTTMVLAPVMLQSPTINATTEYQRDGIKGGIFVPLGNDARDLQEGAASTGTVWNGTNNIAVGTYVFDINNTNNGSYSTEATAAVILLSGQWSAVNVNSYALARPRSGVDSDATIQIRAKLADYSEDTQGIVPLDANGQFEVRINNATMNKAICRLVGYYI